jgi:hypothetical protein
MIIGAGLLLSKVNYPTPSIPSTLINDLARYYKLDGNGIEEVVGANATTVSLSAGVGGWRTGILGQAAEFGGNTLNQIRAPALDLVGDLTLSFWYRYRALGSAGYCPAISQMLGAGGDNINYAVLQNATSLTLYGRYDTSYLVSIDGISDTWVHCVFTRTTAGLCTGYRNGIVVTSHSGPIPFSVPTADLIIGHRDDNYSGFDGAIDEVGIWSRILTTTEIEELYAGGAALTYPF